MRLRLSGKGILNNRYNDIRELVENQIEIAEDDLNGLITRSSSLELYKNFHPLTYIEGRIRENEENIIYILARLMWLYGMNGE